MLQGQPRIPASAHTCGHAKGGSYQPRGAPPAARPAGSSPRGPRSDDPRSTGATPGTPLPAEGVTHAASCSCPGTQHPTLPPTPQPGQAKTPGCPDVPLLPGGAAAGRSPPAAISRPRRLRSPPGPPGSPSRARGRCAGRGRRRCSAAATKWRLGGGKGSTGKPRGQPVLLSVMG